MKRPTIEELAQYLWTDSGGQGDLYEARAGTTNHFETVAQTLLDQLHTEPYISRGNLKMDTPTFSLPAVVTCPGRTPMCTRYCYARKAQRQYPNVRTSRQRNYVWSRFGLFEEAVSEIIQKRRLPNLRIHESGDFYSQEYLNKWLRIIAANPATRFWANTKSWHLKWPDPLPPNLSLFWSIWPDTKNAPTSGRFAYAGGCGTGKEFECTGNCRTCTSDCLDPASPGKHFRIH